MPKSMQPEAKRRGRPPTGRDPFIGIRLPAAMIAAIDRWAAREVAGSRSEAIRRLVEQALTPRPQQRAKPRTGNAAVRAARASRAEKAASEQIDRALENTGQPDSVKTQRKRRLTTMPTELLAPRRRT
jgi:Arc/MetJ-type ribon-helix-helix transcriptional regulator